LPFCASCGKEVPNGVAYCPYCGAPVQSIPATPPPPPSMPPMSGAQPAIGRQRPLGVTIIAVLEAIGSIFIIIGGLALIGLAGLLKSGTLPGGANGFPQGAVNIPPFVLAIAGALGGVLIIFGLVGVFLAWGFWSGKGWAWTVGIIFLILGVVGDLVSLGVAGVLGVGSLVSLLINVLILYYLFRPHVKAYFGKGVVTL